MCEGRFELVSLDFPRVWPEACPSQDHVLCSESILEMKTKHRMVLQAPKCRQDATKITEGGGSIQVPWSPGRNVLLCCVG